MGKLLSKIKQANKKPHHLVLISSKASKLWVIDLLSIFGDQLQLAVAL